MKTIPILIILSVSSFLCIGQSVDTIGIWEDLLLITDLSLDDNENCLKVDTFISFHACHNYHGQDINLTYYEFNQEFCDSVRMIPIIKDRNKALSNKIQSFKPDQCS